MARIRTIKPEFCESESIGELSREARLLFILLWTYVDDLGRARASSRLLARRLYPYDDDAMDLIGGWLLELENGRHIRLYVVDGDTYLDIPKWLKHQKIDHPSKSRLPEYMNNRENPRETLAPHTLDLGPVPVPRTSTVEAASLVAEGPTKPKRTPRAKPPKADPVEPPKEAAAASEPDLVIDFGKAEPVTIDAPREEISDAVRAAVAAVTPPPDQITDVVDQTEDAPHGYDENGQPIRNTPMPVYETFAMPAEMPKAPPPPPPPHQVADSSDEARAFNAYNQIASLQGWQQAMFLNTTVRFRLQARLAEAAQLMDPPNPIAGWTQVLMKASNADFLKGPDGKTQRWFDLDFLLDEQKFRRLMEGKYDERRSATGGQPSTGSTLSALARLSAQDPG